MEDAYGTARLAAKGAESAIVTRICEDFNLTPVLTRALMSRWLVISRSTDTWRCGRASCAFWRWGQMSRPASRSLPAGRSRWLWSLLRQRISRACTATGLRSCVKGAWLAWPAGGLRESVRCSVRGRGPLLASKTAVSPSGVSMDRGAGREAGCAGPSGHLASNVRIGLLGCYGRQGGSFGFEPAPG